eukprot:1586716-Pyramimonas_sp.AAC.1
MAEKRVTRNSVGSNMVEIRGPFHRSLSEHSPSVSTRGPRDDIPGESDRDRPRATQSGRVRRAERATLSRREKVPTRSAGGLASELRVTLRCFEQVCGVTIT